MEWVIDDIAEVLAVKEELITKWHEVLKRSDIKRQIKEYSYRLFDNRFVVYNERIL